MTLEHSWVFVKRGRDVVEQRWVGPEMVDPPPMPVPVVPHQCRRLDAVCDYYVIDCGVYICPWCERALPWCFGAADDTPAICDDCWGKLEASK